MEEMGKIEGKITSMLEDGYSLSRIAKSVGKSPAAILKRARRYVREGKLERINKYPAMYRKAQILPTPNSYLPNLPPSPIMLPHRFGASFAQVGMPPLKFGKNGRASIETASHSIQFGKHKASIWLKSGFVGQTIKEQINNGVLQLIALGKKYSAQFGIELSFLRLYDDIEWVDPDLERSAATAQGADMGKGEKVEVAGAIHVYSDATHEGQIEFNAKPKGDPTKPTDHAKVREYIYSGRLAADLYAIKEVLGEVQGVVVQVRQRLDMMDKGARK